jgi:hypothetical protein
MLASDTPPEGAAVSTSRGVSSAEKYAELEAAGLPRPTCECHGEPKLWNKTGGCVRGGFWFCAVRHRVQDNLRLLTPGTCGTRGCERPKHRFSGGTYDLRCLEHARARKRVRSGSSIPPLAPALSSSEIGRLGGTAAQDLYDRNPEAWARLRRGVVTAGLEKTRKRLEREDAQSG